MDEEPRKFMQNSSDEKRLEDEEEDSEDNNVPLEEEIDNEVEANALRKEEDSDKDEFNAVSYTTNQTFHMSRLQLRFKTCVVTKRKAPSNVDTKLVVRVRND